MKFATVLLSAACVGVNFAPAAAQANVKPGEGPAFCAAAVPGGFTLGASFDDVYACGASADNGSGRDVPYDHGNSTGASKGFFEQGAGYQCVELANRFMYDVWGYDPIFDSSFNGYSLTGENFAQSVTDAYSAVPLENNGVAGEPFQAGDIVSFANGKTDGHVAVVISSTENASGNGQVRMMDENYSYVASRDSSGSVLTFNVSSWTLQPAYGQSVVDFDAFVPPPAQVLTRSGAANHILEVLATKTAYLANQSGQPEWIPDALTYDCYGATYPVMDVTQAQVNALGNGQPWAPRCQRAQDAANHLLVVSATNTAYWANGQGVPEWIQTSAIFDCFVNEGVPVIRGLAQSQINALGTGKPWATCGGSNPSTPVPTTASGPTITAGNDGGRMTISLQDFPTGAIHFFCHFGSGYPTGGSVYGPYATTVTNSSESWPTGSGWCYGTGNAWVGIQASDGQSYYSNQVNL